MKLSPSVRQRLAAASIVAGALLLTLAAGMLAPIAGVAAAGGFLFIGGMLALEVRRR